MSYSDILADDKSDRGQTVKRKRTRSEEESVPDINAVSNEDLLSLLKTYMNSKFSGIESNFQEMKKSLEKKVSKAKTSFQIKGHNVQFEFRIGGKY